MAVLTDRAEVSRLEVVETGRRRRWAEDEKLRIVTEREPERSAAGGGDGAAVWSVSVVVALWSSVATMPSVDALPDDAESLKRLLLAREGELVVARAHAATVTAERPPCGPRPPTTRP